MTRDLWIEAIRPEALSHSDLSLWRLFRLHRPELASPYFDPRYAMAAGKVCPDAQVAVIRRAGRTVGFLPFQRRGGLIQPLGAPLSDYSGVIAQPGESLDHAAIVRALGARRFRFAGLQACDDNRRALSGASVETAKAMVADLTGGFSAWEEGRRAAGQGKFLKDKRRRRTRLEAEVGPIEFSLAPTVEADLHQIIEQKRAQLRLSGQHDIFACGWTGDLLRRLMDVGSADFGLRTATLKAGGKVLAAELGLLSGAAYHLWFPVYDADYAKYSPGQLMTIDTLRAAAEAGVTRVDFGAGGEDYKRAFADPAETVFEGSVIADRLIAALAAVPGLRRQRTKLDRRLDRIAACEADPADRTRALTKYAAVLAGRHSRLTVAGIGATAAMGLVLGTIAD